MANMASFLSQPIYRATDHVIENSILVLKIKRTHLITCCTFVCINRPSKEVCGNSAESLSVSTLFYAILFTHKNKISKLTKPLFSTVN